MQFYIFLNKLSLVQKVLLALVCLLLLGLSVWLSQLFMNIAIYSVIFAVGLYFIYFAEKRMPEHHPYREGFSIIGLTLYFTFFMFLTTKIFDLKSLYAVIQALAIIIISLQVIQLLQKPQKIAIES